MKTFTLFMFCCISLHAYTQLFLKITDGALVTTAADSRSCNFVDINGDMLDDIFISSGPFEGNTNMLYINNGDGTFSEITTDAIVSDTNRFDGATFADCDNDGDADCFVVTWYGEKNYFYTNNGDGTFAHITDVEMQSANTYSETASWGDYDNDGWLDLYVTNSAGDKHNLLYRNTTDGDFEKITGIDPVEDMHKSRGVNWTDLNGDGAIDLLVVNEDTEPDDMFLNNGAGVFTKVTTGDVVEAETSTMSSSSVDVDNDLDADIITASWEGQNNQLFIQNADGNFIAATTGDLTTDTSYSFTTACEDYDNDGDIDLFITNGFADAELVNYAYLNDGAGNFTRDLVSFPDLSTVCSYGAAWGDANNDGFPDLVIANCRGLDGTADDPFNTFYLNNGNDNHWIKIHLTGSLSNMSAIGAKIKVRAVIDGEVVWQMREVSAQNGYCSQNSFTAHFGLGDATVADSIIINWPSGTETILLNEDINATLLITETIPETIPSTQQLINAWLSQNLADDMLFLHLSSEALKNMQLSFRILNAEGKVVNAQNIQYADSSARTFPIKLSGLAAGIYFLQLHSEGPMIANLRFVVQ